MNKHGLPRDIPEPVKRAVRQRCGFGCVICGSAVVQYHHFNPSYEDSTEHSEMGITLLCGRCHQKAHQAGTAEITRRNATPICKSLGFTRDFLFTARDESSFQIGGATFRRAIVAMYDDEVLIGFAAPEEVGGPFRLFATFTDEDGNEILRIVDNEWRSGIELFDVDTSNGNLVIRKNQGNIALRMLLRDGRIELDRMNMSYKGFNVSIESEWLTVRNPKGGKLNLKCPNVRSTLRLRSDGAVTI